MQVKLGKNIHTVLLAVLLVIASVAIVQFNNSSLTQYSTEITGLAVYEQLSQQCKGYFGDSICDDSPSDCGQKYQQGVSIDACDECQTYKDGKQGFNQCSPSQTSTSQPPPSQPSAGTQTPTPPSAKVQPPGSCQNSCNGQSKTGSCYCDATSVTSAGDYCADIAQHCPDIWNTPGNKYKSVTGTTAPPPTSPPAQPKLIGDFDNNECVDFKDFSLFADAFGKSDSNYAKFDLNGDGSINQGDHLIFSSNFGKGCIAKMQKILEGKTGMPEQCPAVVNYVCGSDGKTYKNPCEAKKAGVIEYKVGGCEQKKGILEPCYSGEDCITQYCNPTTKKCANKPFSCVQGQGVCSFGGQQWCCSLQDKCGTSKGECLSEAELSHPKDTTLFCEKGVPGFETKAGECNPDSKPFYCNPTKMQLELKCSLCGCSLGEKCREDGGCGSQSKPCGDKVCLESQACINNQCVLKQTTYKLGLVYVYNSQDTYNPNWKTDIGKIIPKAEKALKDVSDGKINAKITILGEVQTNIFCWNPAKLIRLKIRDDNTKDEYIQIIPMTGSQLGTPIESLGDKVKIIESECSNCIQEGDQYRINCHDMLSSSNFWETNKLDKLGAEISQKLKVEFNDYDGVIIIFGKVGRPLENDPKFLEWACHSIYSGVVGYSNLIFAENSIIDPKSYLINCGDVGKPFSLSHYQKAGWQSIVHEILHRFGAVDIYETGGVYGVKTNRKTALEIDPLADESVMGNRDRKCIDEGGNEVDGIICTKEELERVYLDKYNRQKIGLSSS